MRCPRASGTATGTMALVMALAMAACSPSSSNPPMPELAASPEPALMRVPYVSTATGGNTREFLLYVPAGHARAADTNANANTNAGSSTPQPPWPVLLFLHGGGERGDGLEDLGHVMTHGPMMEAWKQHRDLPFLIIAPQLPMFDQPLMSPNRSEPDLSRPDAPPAADRLSNLTGRTHSRATNPALREHTPISRGPSDAFPSGSHERFGDYPENGLLPQGWEMVADDVMAMVDSVLAGWNGDPDRVYVTGLSYGGFGALHYAARFPERWAAIAPVVGTGNPSDAPRMAEQATPIWMFGGGADTVIKPHWLYTMAAALEDAGHPDVRLTIHEDMGHDAWKRVYAGQDVYDWMLSNRRTSGTARP